jgi:Fe-S-cluster containining protein
MGACRPDCGACCDPVTVSWDPEAIKSWTSKIMSAVPDPRSAVGWLHWLRNGFDPDERANAVAWWLPGSERQTNADFIAEHWTLLDSEPDHTEGSTVYRLACDAYDPATRSCTAHDARPPVCRGFPHYGADPDPGRGLPHTCGFVEDVRRVLPIVEIRSGGQAVPAGRRP